jgi:plastocyanin
MYETVNKEITPGFVLLLMAFELQAGTLTFGITDSSDNPVADAVIYLQNAGTMPIPGSGLVQIEQKGKEFHPFVIVIPTGTSVLFPNRDGIGHHVYSFSGAKTFQLPLSEQETTDSVLFDSPGVVTVGCNIHDWMVAYIYVVNTPFYTVSTADGTANIENVPAGEYTLHVWHPGIKSNTDMEQQIIVQGDAARQLDFTIDLKPEYFWKPARPADQDEEQY